MLYKSSNIPHTMLYSAMSAEILRICKATTKCQDFIKSAKILTGRIIKKELIKNLMNKAPLKLFNGHEECFIKFWETNDYILNKI